MLQERELEVQRLCKGEDWLAGRLGTGGGAGACVLQNRAGSGESVDTGSYRRTS